MGRHSGHCGHWSATDGYGPPWMATVRHGRPGTATDRLSSGPIGLKVMGEGRVQGVNPYLCLLSEGDDEL